VNIFSSGAGLLNAWIDYNQDGDWADAGEQIFTNQVIASGSNNLNVNIPGTAAVGNTFARMRISTAGGGTYTGIAADGEVEDCQVTIVAANQAPVIVAGGTLAYTENDPATAIDNSLTITDSDDGTMVSATCQITNNYQNGEDILAFANGNNITGTWTPASGTISLAGGASTAFYQAALRSISYENPNEHPFSWDRTVSWTVNDGEEDSLVVTSTIDLTPVNDVPVLSDASDTLAYTENDPASIIDGSLTIADIDTNRMVSATIQITGNYQNGQDILAFVDTGNITGTWTAASGTMSLDGGDSLGLYEAALESITYVNTEENPNTGARTVSWTVNDEFDDSNTVTSTITVAATNDLPVIAGAGGTLAYNEGDGTQIIDSALTITDPDNTNLDHATIQITANYDNGEDLLDFTPVGSVTLGGWNGGLGRLTLDGPDTLANFELALESVTYENTNADPSILTRTITWIINDGTDDSVGVTSTITVAAANDAPTMTAGGNLAYTEGDGSQVLDATVTVADVDDTNIEEATIQITGNYQNGVDVLAFTNQLGIIGNWISATGVLELTGTSLVANYQTAMRSITFANPSDDPSTAGRTVAWTVNDGELSSTPATSTITITAVNDAPVMGDAGGTLAYTENDPASIIDGTLTITDVDDTNIEDATIQITINYQNGEDVLAFTNQLGITGNWVSATGTMELTGTASLADYETALESITYQNLLDNPNTGDRTVSWTVNDGTYDSNTETSTITITAVNDAPTANAGGVYSINEGEPLTLNGGGSTDPDGDTLTYAWDLNNDGAYDDATGVNPTVHLDWQLMEQH